MTVWCEVARLAELLVKPWSWLFPLLSVILLLYNHNVSKKMNIMFFFFLHLMLWKVISSCHHLYYRSYKQSLPHQPLFLLMKKKKNLCYQKKQKMHSPEDTWTELWLCGASTIQLPVNEELISKLNCIRMSITINLWFDLQELLS